MSALIEPTTDVLREELTVLRHPAVYPDHPRHVETIETHCSWVFLTDWHAYKLKKPMRLDRMDNLLLSSRQRSCFEEVRLNRRLAPDVYLDVVGLKRNPAGNLCFDGQGAPVEWLVKMRRLPRELMLDRAIADHTATLAAVRAVGALLVSFYRGLPSVPMSGEDYVRRLAEQIGSNRTALLEDDLGLPRDTVEDVLGGQLEFLKSRLHLFRERAERGKIIEGHGDLKPEHVCLGDPPCIIDCLEFDRDLRLLDPLEELAFFALECDRLGARWIGQEVLDLYVEKSGDSVEMELFEFYFSRRATQRAITIAWHLRDPRVRQQKDWRRLAVSYLKRPLQEHFEIRHFEREARAASQPAQLRE